MLAIFANLNAASHSHKVNDLKPFTDFLSQHKIEFKLIFTDDLLDLKSKLAEQYSLGYRRYMVYGGDGSMHHFINALYCISADAISTVKIGIIPAGTGNDWVRNLSNDPYFSLQNYIQNKSQKLDIGKIYFQDGSVRFFFNMGGIGFNGDVIQKVEKFKFLGIFSYYFALIYSFFGYKARKLSIGIDQEKIEKNTFILSIGLGKYAGGNMKLCPNAILDDGYFDINLIEEIGLWKLVRYLHTLTDGSYLQYIDCISKRVKSLDIIQNSELYAEADGEFLGNNIAKFEIVEKGCEFYV